MIISGFNPSRAKQKKHHTIVLTVPNISRPLEVLTAEIEKELSELDFPQRRRYIQHLASMYELAASSELLKFTTAFAIPKFERTPKGE